MQSYFYDLSDFLTKRLAAGEVYTASFSGEDSDFVRFNHDRVRQSGRVEQRYYMLDLIKGARHAAGAVTLSGERAEDEQRLNWLLADLRAKVAVVPEDPHLLYATEVKSSEQKGENRLPPAEQAVADIVAAGEGHDLVGIFAQGGVHAGFANSLGQRNFFVSHSYNFEWSLYHAADKAVKSSYAGFAWDRAALTRKMASAVSQLAVLKREPKTIPPGKYRVYLAPWALSDCLGMLAWGGYGLKSHRTKTTALLRLIEGTATFSPAVTLVENTKEGVSPNFQEKGFTKPDSVTLIEKGRFANCLISPRSAKEYGVPTNGANGGEVPTSLDMAAGDVPEAEVLSRLDTGVWINNVWYLNFSDRPACRITGMTRFACFWVEKGKVVAPLNVMRFDESLFRALGENLVGLTREREMLLDAGTYGARSTESNRVPGALIRDFNFNL